MELQTGPCEDTTDANALTFDLSGIKSDIDHLDEIYHGPWKIPTHVLANYYTTKSMGIS